MYSVFYCLNILLKLFLLNLFKVHWFFFQITKRLNHPEATEIMSAYGKYLATDTVLATYKLVEWTHQIHEKNWEIKCSNWLSVGALLP